MYANGSALEADGCTETLNNFRTPFALKTSLLARHKTTHGNSSIHVKDIAVYLSQLVYTGLGDYHLAGHTLAGPV